MARNPDWCLKVNSKPINYVFHIGIGEWVEP